MKNPCASSGRVCATSYLVLEDGREVVRMDCPTCGRKGLGVNATTFSGRLYTPQHNAGA